MAIPHSSVSPYLNDNQIPKAGSFRPAHLLLTLSQPTDLTRMAAFCNTRTALWHHTGLQHITGMFQVYQTSSNMQIKHFFPPLVTEFAATLSFNSFSKVTLNKENVSRWSWWNTIWALLSERLFNLHSDNIHARLARWKSAKNNASRFLFGNMK